MQFRVIASTLNRIFPKLYLFRHSFRSDAPALALVGFKRSALDWQSVRARCEEERAANGISDPSVRHAEGLALLFIGMWEEQEPRSRSLNTLGNLWIELDAGRERVTGNPGAKYLYGSRWLEFLERYQHRWTELTGLPKDLRELPKAGLEISQLIRQTTQNPPSSSGPMTAVVSRLPAALLQDAKADWFLWPGPPHMAQMNPRE